MNDESLLDGIDRHKRDDLQGLVVGKYVCGKRNKIRTKNFRNQWSRLARSDVK